MSAFIEVKLVKETTSGADANFEQTTTPTGVTVIAKSKGVTRTEFYAASNTKYRPEIVLEIWADEYNGETCVIIGSVEYTVIRTYPPKPDKIELTCQQKGADENVYPELD